MNAQSTNKIVSFQATRGCGTSKKVNFTALAEQEKSYLTANPSSIKSFKANGNGGGNKGKGSTNDVGIPSGIPTINVYFHVITSKFGEGKAIKKLMIQFRWEKR